MPALMERASSRKPRMLESWHNVNNFSEKFLHFYFQLFQVLMHMPKIFFKSSMILASYAFPVVLICNACTRMRVRACRENKLCALKSNRDGPRIAERAFSIPLPSFSLFVAYKPHFVPFWSI